MVWIQVWRFIFIFVVVILLWWFINILMVRILVWWFIFIFVVWVQVQGCKSILYYGVNHQRVLYIIDSGAGMQTKYIILIPVVNLQSYFILWFQDHFNIINGMGISERNIMNPYNKPINPPYKRPLKDIIIVVSSWTGVGRYNILIKYSVLIVDYNAPSKPNQHKPNQTTTTPSHSNTK